MSSPARTKSSENITDEQILAYELSIKEQEQKKVALVGPRLPLLETLGPQYENNQEGNNGSSPSFLRKLQELDEQGFRQFRRCRGDGNCFYRAFSFLFIEWLVSTNSESEIARYLALVRDNHMLMLSIGFDEFAFSDFEDEFVAILQECQQRSTIEAVDYLYDAMNDDMRSNAIVVYMRLLTSTYLRLHADEYVPFLESGETIESFCNAQVEAMDREADEMHITALTNILDIGVRVAYLNAAGAHVTFHEFGSNSKLNLLYRPGHYDILYLSSTPQ